uniref:Uncharacterized protein n=1 Tax=Pygocentrus nattereri TaxID=42514 RepID=A0A3B4CPM9_PYGNA
MPVQAFSFPVPETRFFQLYIKLSIVLQNAVRAVLMNLDNLQPFTTQHFNIFPYKSRWERVSELRFKKGDMKLSAYPFLLTLYVETTEPVPQHTGEQHPVACMCLNSAVMGQNYSARSENRRHDLLGI